MQKTILSLQALMMRAALLFCCLLAVSALPAHAGVEELLQGSIKRFRFQLQPVEVPDVQFVDAAGQPVHLSQFRGKLVLLTLWATWCPYCIKELPDLVDLQAIMGTEHFMALPVSVDKEGPDIAKRFLEERSINLPTYSDSRAAIKSALNTHGIPYSILIDKEGREIGRIYGETKWTSGEAVNLLRAFMN